MIAGCISDGKSVHWTEMVEMRGEKSKNFLAVGPFLAFRLSCKLQAARFDVPSKPLKLEVVGNAQCRLSEPVLPHRLDAGRRNLGLSVICFIIICLLFVSHRVLILEWHGWLGVKPDIWSVQSPPSPVDRRATVQAQARSAGPPQSSATPKALA